MYPLVLCSMIALGVIIAKYLTLFQAIHGTKKVLRDVEELAVEGDVEGAIELAYATPGPASAILLAGLGLYRVVFGVQDPIGGPAPDPSQDPRCW